MTYLQDVGAAEGNTRVGERADPFLPTLPIPGHPMRVTYRQAATPPWQPSRSRQSPSRWPRPYRARGSANLNLTSPHEFGPHERGPGPNDT